MSGSLPRRALRRLPLFGVIAICFFLPCVHGCDVAVSPVGQIAHHGLSDWKGLLMDTAWVLPPFATAAAMAALLALVAWRPANADVLGLAAGTVLLGWAAGLPITILVVFHSGDAGQRTLLVLAFAALPEAVAALCGWRVLRARGWPRWDWLTIAWSALAAASPVGALIAMELRDEVWTGRRAILPGAWVYSAAVLAMLGLSLRSLRRPPAAAPGP